MPPAPDDLHGEIAGVVQDQRAGELADGSPRARRLARGELGAGAHRDERLHRLHGVELHQLLTEDGSIDEPSLGRLLDEPFRPFTVDPSRRAGSDGHPFVHEHGGGHVPAVVEIAEEVIGRDPHVREEDLVEMHAAVDLMDRTYLDSVGVHRYHEHRDSCVLGHVRVGAGDDHAVFAHMRQRRPDLLAVHDPFVAIALSPRLEAGDVGPRARLGEHLAPHVLGRDVARQPPLLLFVGAVLGQHRQAHAMRYDELERHVRVGAVLLAPDPLVGFCQPGAAVLDGVGQPGQAGLGQGALEPSAELETTLAAGIRVAIEMDSGGVIVEELLDIGPGRPRPRRGRDRRQPSGLTLAIVHIVCAGSAG